ncbi:MULTISPECIES: DMT family transporter [unclassified Mesorhizobium]|uniref:DMT family transporter n=1 Tax=unclassified Mesorhizobium TaxID=325217 RepID=UPI000BAF5E19|nr:MULTISPECIES: DMT family transporter [unclassified Mesorhizobium]TGT60522.1 DMT family transporter [Mesorhizobium sp. M00.F.Ca.ET.170.01.1.1]AZO10375.1 DMT family transporter [Mesorhizobium sp. M3A.F.Ca.ET.080.04.2.1]PBB87899.1 EamA family transporter [Mesorhizobium sp. WSM3876]RWB73630.1 MAG: DMT family transporter [Mesorhizobium sp.]RWB91813.1 MAG: DMT family transporter [Mesorhizobium sp.]
MPGSKSPSLRIGSGVITILVTVFAMALADAFIKFVSADMTLWQIYVLRSLFVVPVLALLAGRRSWPSGLRWILLRSLALTLMYLAIYGVIPFLSLPVLAASLYTGPLFIVGLSAVFLHEPISARHWLAISTGFAGVLLIVRPAASGFTPLALVPIVAAFLYALAAVLTRAKCSHVPALTLTLWLNLVLLAFGSVASLSIAYAGIGSAMHYPFLSASWATMDGHNWQVIFILAGLMVGISVGLAKAYQSPRPQVIATFDYAYLPFAALWGFVFFGEIPDLWTVLGMALIAAAGLIVLRATSRRTPSTVAV